MVWGMGIEPIYLVPQTSVLTFGLTSPYIILAGPTRFELVIALRCLGQSQMCSTTSPRSYLYLWSSGQESNLQNLVSKTSTSNQVASPEDLIFIGTAGMIRTLIRPIWSRQFYQLNYSDILALPLGIEPRTRGSSGHCSTNWAKPPFIIGGYWGI